MFTSGSTCLLMGLLNQRGFWCWGRSVWAHQLVLPVFPFDPAGSLPLVSWLARRLLCRACHPVHGSGEENHSHPPSPPHFHFPVPSTWWVSVDVSTIPGGCKNGQAQFAVPNTDRSRSRRLIYDIRLTRWTAYVVIDSRSPTSMGFAVDPVDFAANLKTRRLELCKNNTFLDFRMYTIQCTYSNR